MQENGVRRWIGIDPGQHGGIAIVNATPGWARTWPIPETEREILALLHAIKMETSVSAVIEKLGPRPPAMCSCKTNWSLSGSYHGLRMALTAQEIPWEEALPKRWQAAFSLVRGKGWDTKRWKAYLRERAQSMFPDVEVKNETADALLIAVFARRLYAGGEA